MCNAHNHRAGCNCGWGQGINNSFSTGSTNYTTTHYRSTYGTALTPRYESYLIPSASCPVCGASVFFYQCPNGGRVFFDCLGKPWEKHPCTDNGLSVKHSLSNKKINYSSLKYKPLIISDTYHINDTIIVSAKLDNKQTFISIIKSQLGRFELNKNILCVAREVIKNQIIIEYIISFLNEKGNPCVIKGKPVCKT